MGFEDCEGLFWKRVWAFEPFHRNLVFTPGPVVFFPMSLIEYSMFVTAQNYLAEIHGDS